MEIRPLGVDDIKPYVAFTAAHADESGRDGDLHHGPYPRGEGVAEGFAERTRERWTRGLDEADWRRAWGVFDGERIVGSGDLTGSELAAERHRARLGMGLLRTHRGRGAGSALLDAMIAWARAEPRLAWIDLGVFVGNDVAERLYRRAGFVEIGVVADRFRVDGLAIDDRMMALGVGEPGPADAGTAGASGRPA